MIDAIYQKLLADDYLSRTLTGGIYLDTEVSRQFTPDAFDNNNELLPTGLLVQEPSFRNPSSPYRWTETQPFAIYVYERRVAQAKDMQRAYGAIRPVMTQIKRLFHLESIEPLDRLQAAWFATHEETIWNAHDDALDSKMGKISFTVETSAAGSC